jgi:molecular chaperone DnaK (HSP70)
MDYLSRLSLENRKLIVGVDFGTTFSGLAWASTSRVRLPIPHFSTDKPNNSHRQTS